MAEIQILELTITYFERTGSKNKILQLISPILTVSFSFVTSSRSYSIIEINGIQICITPNKNLDVSSYDYALLSEKRATQDALENNRVILKKWLKHPQRRNYTTEEITNSWANNFNFFEENITENTNGLREPQIAA